MNKNNYDFIITLIIIIAICVLTEMILITKAMPYNNYCGEIANSKLQDINSSYSMPYCYPETKTYYIQ